MARIEDAISMLRLSVGKIIFSSQFSAGLMDPGMLGQTRKGSPAKEFTLPRYMSRWSHTHV